MMHLLIVLVSLYSEAREVDPSGPGPGRPPRCRAALVERCRTENASARDAELARIRGIQALIAPRENERKELELLRADGRSRISALEENLRLGERERDFLEQEVRSERPARPVWNDPETALSLSATHGHWLENLPGGRLSRLQNALENSSSELLGHREADDRICLQIRTFEEEIRSLENASAEARRKAEEHAKMWESGCEQLYCSND